MKVSTEIDNNFGYEKITQLVDNIPLSMCVNGIDSITSSSLPESHEMRVVSVYPQCVVNP
jgi:hypothetical protein